MLDRTWKHECLHNEWKEVEVRRAAAGLLCGVAVGGPAVAPKANSRRCSAGLLRFYEQKYRTTEGSRTWLGAWACLSATRGGAWRFPTVTRRAASARRLGVGLGRRARAFGVGDDGDSASGRGADSRGRLGARDDDDVRWLCDCDGCVHVSKVQTLAGAAGLCRGGLDAWCPGELVCLVAGPPGVQDVMGSWPICADLP